MGHPRYTKEELGRRGRELYECTVLPQIGEGNRGKIVVMDVETGEWEIGDDNLELAHRMLAKRPDAALYAMRVGFPAVVKIGGSWGAAAR
jgi:hypothetical protein